MFDQGPLVGDCSLCYSVFLGESVGDVKVIKSISNLPLEVLAQGLSLSGRLPAKRGLEIFS